MLCLSASLCCQDQDLITVILAKPSEAKLNYYEYIPNYIAIPAVLSIQLKTSIKS